MNYALDTLLYGMQFRKLMEKEMQPIETEYGLYKIDVQILLYLKRAGEQNTSKDIMQMNMFTRGHISQSLSRLDYAYRAELAVRAEQEIVVSALAAFFDPCLIRFFFDAGKHRFERKFCVGEHSDVGRDVFAVAHGVFAAAVRSAVAVRMLESGSGTRFVVFSRAVSVFIGNRTRFGTGRYARVFRHRIIGR